MSDINNTVKDIDAVHEEFHKEFTPSVHKIGAGTMAVALLLSVLPTIYFVFIKGIDIPWANFVAVVVAIASFAISTWLSEPVAFWPVIGSAATYFAFLSGNASSMRLPVALAARAFVDEPDDPSNPKFHVATIIALFASVVVNLAILLVIIILGDIILGMMPASVLAAFGFIMPCLTANNILMRCKDRQAKFIPGFFRLLPYLLAGFITPYICKALAATFPIFGMIDMLFAVGAAILVGYVIYRRDVAAEAKAGE